MHAIYTYLCIYLYIISYVCVSHLLKRLTVLKYCSQTQCLNICLGFFSDNNDYILFTSSV